MSLGLRRIPEGVASPRGDRLFVPTRDGGIAAIATATGGVLWTSGAGKLALYASRDRLLVLAAGAQPRWLGVDDGQPLAADPPAWAPGVDEFEIDRCWLTRRSLGIAWRALISKPPSATAAAAGSFAVGLHDPKLKPFAAQAPAAPAWPGADDVEAFADTGHVLAPIHSGADVVALGVRSGEAGRELVLCRRRSGQAGEAIPLLDRMPRAGYLEAHESADGSLVALHLTNDSAQDDRPPGSVCEWRLFSLPDGRPLATLPAGRGLAPPFARVGRRLLARAYGRIPAKRKPPLRELVAFDLPSATEAWRHPLPATPSFRRF